MSQIVRKKCLFTELIKYILNIDGSCELCGFGELEPIVNNVGCC